MALISVRLVETEKGPKVACRVYDQNGDERTMSVFPEYLPKEVVSIDSEAGTAELLTPWPITCVAWDYQNNPEYKLLSVVDKPEWDHQERSEKAFLGELQIERFSSREVLNDDGSFAGLPISTNIKIENERRRAIRHAKKDMKEAGLSDDQIRLAIAEAREKAEAKKAQAKLSAKTGPGVQVSQPTQHSAGNETAARQEGPSQDKAEAKGDKIPF